MPRADADDDERPRQQARADDVPERQDGRGVEHERGAVGDVRDAVAELVADGVAQEPVGHHHGERRRVPGDHDEPEDGRVHPPVQLVPAEHPQPQQRRLEEERDHRLDGERGAEHLARDVEQPGEVQPELQLEQDPRDDAERVVDQVQLAPEPGGVLVDLEPGDRPPGLEDRDHGSEAQGHEDEQEVEAREQGELRAGGVDGAHERDARRAGGPRTLFPGEDRGRFRVVPEARGARVRVVPECGADRA